MPKVFSVWFASILLFMCSFWTAAEPVENTVFYSLSDQMQGSTVVAKQMVSNPQGGLWIVDKQGELVFFDGRQLNTVTDSDGNIISGVTDVAIVDQLLWLVKDEHAFRYDPVTGELFPLVLGSANVWFVEKSGNEIWFADGQGLYVVVGNEQQAKLHPYPDKLEPSGLYATGDTIFVAGKSGVYEFYDNKFQKEPFYPQLKVTAVFEDSNQQLWFGTEGGLYYSRQKLPFVAGSDLPFSPEPPITSITETAQGLWAGTRSGLYHIDLQSHTLSHHRAYPHDSFAIDGNQIIGLLNDEQGALWVATNKGLNYLPGITSYFRRLRFSLDTRSLQARHINDIVQLESDHIWLATDNGLAELSESLELIRSLPDFGGVNDMAYRDGKLWVGTDKGLKIFSTNSGEWVDFQFPQWIKDERVTSVAVDHYGSVWIGMSSQLYRYWPKSDELIPLGSHWIQSSSEREEVTVVFEDSDHQIWVGTDYALYRFEAGRLNLVEESVGQGGVQDIYEDRVAQLWVVNHDSLQLARNISPFHLQTVPMVGERVTPYCVVGDESGVWLGSSKGLSHYSFSAQPKQHLSPPFGVIDNEFYAQSCLYLQSGRVLFGSREGVLEVNPEVLQGERKLQPGLVVRGGLVDQPLRTLAGSGNQVWVVPYGSAIRFQVGRLPFSGTESWQYRLVGSGDESWKHLDDNGLMFDQLSSGQYQLELKPRFLSQDASPAASFSFLIQRPWYLSYWLSSLTAVFLLLVFSGVVLWRSRVYYKQNLHLKQAICRKTAKIELHKKQLYASNQQLQQILHMRQQFMAQLSNEMRIPLVHTMEPLKKMSATGSCEWDESLNTVARNVERALLLTEQLLNRDALAFVEPDRVCEQLVSPLVQASCMSWQPEADKKGIILYVEDETEGLSIKMAPYHLEIVLGNLLSNALKYTARNGCISVSVKQMAHHLLLSVSDTGKGIAKDARDNIFDCYFKEDGDYNIENGFGLGLSTVKQVIDCYGGEISVVSYQGIGSEFIVTLPLYREGSQDLPLKEGDAGREDELPCLLIASADDEVIACLSALFENCRLLIVSDGYEAVILAREQQPDIVLCDLQLPGLGGVDVCNRLYHDVTDKPASFVLLLTEYEQNNIPEPLPGLAATIEKPLDADEVMEQLTSLLEKDDSPESDNNLETELADSVATEGTNPWRMNVVSLVESNFHDPDFGTSTAAKALYMSERNLQRKFKQEFGMSLKDYIVKFRFQQAKLMLRQGDRVSDVALSCGFNEPSYFSARFKGCFGMTPSQYAAKYLNREVQ